MEKGRFYFEVSESGLRFENVSIPGGVILLIKGLAPLFQNENFKGITWKIDAHKGIIIRPVPLVLGYNFVAVYTKLP